VLAAKKAAAAEVGKSFGHFSKWMLYFWGLKKLAFSYV
jgi:hypothetical protein